MDNLYARAMRGGITSEGTVTAVMGDISRPVPPLAEFIWIC